MDPDEIAGQLAAHDIIATTTLALCLALIPNDPDAAKAKSVLDGTRSLVSRYATDVGLSDKARAAAIAHADFILGRVLQNLDVYRAN